MSAPESLTTRSIPPLLVVALSVVLTVFIGIGDRITGADLAFTMLYLAPVGICAWWVSVRAGVAMAALAAALSIANTWHDGMRLHILLWNEIGSLLIFVGMAVLLNRVRSYIDRERQKKEAIVDQLRHADRLNVIGTLAAGVAHEIGTPLNVISGSAELLPGAPATEIAEIATVIQGQAERITAIVRHLLDFGRRAGTGRVTLDLNDITRASLALLTPLARKRNATLTVDEAPAPVLVRGNASEIEQVISNLVLNALQALPDDGGEVTVRIRTAAHANGHPASEVGAIIVEDTGVGIAPESLSHIFDPFFTTKGIGEGTGLGLSVSYGIVNDHDGSISVDSTVGRGTRFTVQLPLATPGAEN